MYYSVYHLLRTKGIDAWQAFHYETFRFVVIEQDKRSHAHGFLVENEIAYIWNLYIFVNTKKQS
jgi:hypothetical protein